MALVYPHSLAIEFPVPKYPKQAIKVMTDHARKKTGRCFTALRVHSFLRNFKIGCYLCRVETYYLISLSNREIIKFTMAA